jgi:hypothetical protein
MSQATISKVKKFILPYSTSHNGKESGTSDLELAAIYAVAETDRRKGGILRHTKEEIEFIAKIGYPLWSFPFSKSVFLFDGLNVSEYALPYADIGNVNMFIDGLKSSSKNCESFTAFLAEKANCFVEQNAKNSFELKGLIADPGFLQEFSLYREEASISQDEFSMIGLLAPRINESALLSITAEIAGLASTFKKDVKELNNSIQFMGKTSLALHNEIQGQIKEVKEESALEIKEEEKIIAPQLRAIEHQYNNEIVDLARSIEDKQVPLHSEIIRLKKSKVEANQQIAKYSENAKSAAKSDKMGKEGWKLKIKKAKEELSEIENQIKSKEKAIEELDKKHDSETARLKAALEAEVMKTRSKIVGLEASRDAKVLLMRQDIDMLEKNTKLLSDRIMEIIKNRESNIDELEKIHTTSVSDELDKAVFYVPNYVICYNSGERRRYLSLPPSSINTVGISTKLKGALGVARIRSCFSPRLKEMALLAETIEKQSLQDTIFETELKQLGEKNNILTVGWIDEEIEKGLLHLREKGWLNDKEFGAIMASAKKDLKHP